MRYQTCTILPRILKLRNLPISSNDSSEFWRKNEFLNINDFLKNDYVRLSHFGSIFGTTGSTHIFLFTQEKYLNDLLSIQTDGKHMILLFSMDMITIEYFTVRMNLRDERIMWTELNHSGAFAKEEWRSLMVLIQRSFTYTWKNVNFGTIIKIILSRNVLFLKIC